MAKYSLAKYTLTVKIPQSVASLFGTSVITLGGSNSYTGSISVEHNANLWEVVGDATGSHVFNRNDDKTGNIDVQINQLSDKVRQLKTLINVYRSSQTIEDGLTLEIHDSLGNTICTAEDCMPQKTPNQTFENTAQMQTWRFVCGEITIY